jgi:hypothetical protein
VSVSQAISTLEHIVRRLSTLEVFSYLYRLETLYVCNRASLEHKSFYIARAHLGL